MLCNELNPARPLGVLREFSSGAAAIIVLRRGPFLYRVDSLVGVPELWPRLSATELFLLSMSVSRAAVVCAGDVDFKEGPVCQQGNV